MTEEQFEQLLNKIYEEAFNETAPENIWPHGVLQGSSEGLINGITFLAGDTLVTMVIAEEDENIFGPIVDALMTFETDVAKRIFNPEGERLYLNSEAILLAPKSFFENSKEKRVYERSRFSPIKGPSSEELELLGLEEAYSIYDLESMPELKNSFEELLEFINDKYIND